MIKTRDDLIESLIEYAGDDFRKDQISFVEDCVDTAIDEVCNRMYPWSMSDSKYNSVKRSALQRYAFTIKRIAQFHYDKWGKEGVTTFYESGQTTSFESGGTPSQFFDGIVTMARIV